MAPPHSSPANAVAQHLARAASLRAKGRVDEAVAVLQAAVRLAPRHAEAHHQLGNALKAAGRPEEALQSLFTASELAPSDATTWLNLGVLLLDTHVAGAAVMAFERAVALAPQRPEAHNALGTAHVALGHSGAAIASFEAAIALKPGYAAAHDNLARALRTAGRVDEAIARFRQALALAPASGTHSNLLYTLNFSARCEPDEVAAEHRRWGEREARHAPAAPPPSPHTVDPARRLRVGYVSPDFNQHAVSYFIEPVLAAHTRGAFEVFCYADGHLADAVTQRIRASVEHWVPVASLDDDALAARVRADGIDVLVDLAGHTGRNRLGVFARRAARVQITWIGYPNSTGLAAMDYRITDGVCDPPGDTERWHTESLVRLPEGFSCYRPPDDAPPVSPLPAASRGAITFGCFNNLSKMTPVVVAAWAALLVAVPGSRLVLRARALDDATTAAAVRDAFGRYGVDAARLVLDARTLSVRDHLAAYADVDVALDPFPYNGTTTTCEALWMGVPVLTTAGRTHAARVGASLLTRVGLADWIAASPDALASRGVTLVSDRTALAALRAALRERMRGSPLCDAPRFVAHLEETYRALWRARSAA